MKNILLLLTALLAYTTAYTQSDTISVEKKAGGIACKKGEQYYSPKMLAKALKDDSEATKWHKDQKANASPAPYSVVQAPSWLATRPGAH